MFVCHSASSWSARHPFPHTIGTLCSTASCRCTYLVKAPALATLPIHSPIWCNSTLLALGIVLIHFPHNWNPPLHSPLWMHTFCQVSCFGNSPSTAHFDTSTQTSVYSPSSRAQTSYPISLSTDRRRTDQQGWQIYLVTDDSTQDCCYVRPGVSESTTIAVRQLLNYSLRNNLVHHLQPNKTMSSMMWSVGDLNPGHSVSQPCAAPTELQGDNKEMMLVKSTNIKTKYDEHQWYFTDHHGQYDKHQRQYKMRSFGHRSFSNSKTRTMSSNRNQRRRWGKS